MKLREELELGFKYLTCQKGRYLEKQASYPANYFGPETAVNRSKRAERLPCMMDPDSTVLSLRSE